MNEFLEAVRKGAPDLIRGTEMITICVPFSTDKVSHQALNTLLVIARETRFIPQGGDRRALAEALVRHQFILNELTTDQHNAFYEKEDKQPSTAR